MGSVFLTIGAVFAVLAGLLHVLIFSFESIRWRQPAIWRRFGVTSQADAEVLRPMALNQGFYNLFLAVGALLGVAFLAAGGSLLGAGLAMTLLSVGSMLAAALVLVISNPRLARAAATQGTLPLIAVLLVTVGALTR